MRRLWPQPACFTWEVGQYTHQPMLRHPNRYLSPRTHLQFGEDVGDVALRGTVGDHQFVGDPTVGVPASDESGDLELTWRQHFRGQHCPLRGCQYKPLVLPR